MLYQIVMKMKELEQEWQIEMLSLAQKLKYSMNGKHGKLTITSKIFTTDLKKYKSITGDHKNLECMKANQQLIQYEQVKYSHWCFMQSGLIMLVKPRANLRIKTLKMFL